MDFRTIVRYVGFVLVGILIGLMMVPLLTVWTIPTAIIVAIAAGVTIPMVAGFYGRAADLAKAIFFGLGVFLIIQAVVGTIFGVSLESSYEIIKKRSILILMADPTWLGKAFMTQLLSLCFSGLMTWWFFNVKRQGLLLFAATVMCFGYLAHNHQFQNNRAYRLSVQSYIAGVEARLGEGSTRIDHDSLRRELDSLIPLVIWIPEEGIPLHTTYESDKGRHGDPVDTTKRGDEYFVYLALKAEDPYTKLHYVPARLRKDPAVVGYFRYDEIAFFVREAQEALASGRSGPVPAAPVKTVAAPAAPPAVPAPAASPPAVVTPPVDPIAPTASVEVTVDESKWVMTTVKVGRGQRYWLGPFSSRQDALRVLTCVDGGEHIQLTDQMLVRWGEWARIKAVGGDETLQQVCVKLASGQPLKLKVSNTQPY